MRTLADLKVFLNFQDIFLFFTPIENEALHLSKENSAANTNDFSEQLESF